MNFLSMINRTKELLDKKDVIDPDLDEIIGHGINIAYLAIARDKWRPTFKEKMDAVDGKVPIKALSERFISLKSAITESGFIAGGWAGKDFIHFSPVVSRVWIEYYYLPAPLEFDEDVPLIPASQVDPYAYIYYAASHYYNVKHQHADASVWEAKYRNIADNIHEVRGYGTMPCERWM